MGEGQGEDNISASSYIIIIILLCLHDYNIIHEVETLYSRLSEYNNHDSWSVLSPMSCVIHIIMELSHGCVPMYTAVAS